ncbi:hypothetical protein [Stenotrophomonas sp. Iso1]|nr:hypothetical protein [Stenotrophomonas sp. Iso1]
MSPLSAFEVDLVTGGVSMSADGKSCTDGPMVAAINQALSKAVGAIS